MTQQQRPVAEQPQRWTPEPVKVTAKQALAWAKAERLKLPASGRLVALNAARAVRGLPPFSIMLSMPPGTKAKKKPPVRRVAVQRIASIAVECGHLVIYTSDGQRHATPLPDEFFGMPSRRAITENLMQEAVATA